MRSYLGSPNVPQSLRYLLLGAALSMLATDAAPADTNVQVATDKPTANKPTADKPANELLYTTYFYTANEAFIHGYQDGTKARIVSLEKNATVWKGTVNAGEMRHLKTGPGVFSFLTDKKATILVGTPSSCTAVGYFLRDEDGMFVSDHYYGRLPHAPGGDLKLIVWAWDDMSLHIYNKDTKKTVYEGKLRKHQFIDVSPQSLAGYNNDVLEFKASKPAMAVQVYYDEGFFVPAPNGRTTGRRFRTYVGRTTTGENDLNLIAYDHTARAVVRDLKTEKVIWKGTIEAGDIKPITLSQRFVEVTSDKPISTLVAPYQHHKAGYAEHHFGAGREGTGIDKDFRITTPKELWIFSYYDHNDVTITDGNTGKKVWSGKLGAGSVQGVHPGYGYYRVQSTAGVSVMGGQHACGAEYSPAAGLFRVDEQVYRVATQIIEQRKQRARAQGRKATDAELAAPPSAADISAAQRAVKASTGQTMSDDEVRQRWDEVTKQRK